MPNNNRREATLWDYMSEAHAGEFDGWNEQRIYEEDCREAWDALPATEKMLINAESTVREAADRIHRAWTKLSIALEDAGDPSICPF